MAPVIIIVMVGALVYLGRSTARANPVATTQGAQLQEKPGAGVLDVLDEASRRGAGTLTSGLGSAPSTVGTPLTAVHAEVQEAQDAAQQDMDEAEQAGQSYLMMAIGSTETTQAAYEAGQAAMGGAADAIAGGVAAAGEAAATVDQRIAAGVRGMF